jgi:hypothetical protein
MVPIRIQAQALRRRRNTTHDGAFALLPDDHLVRPEPPGVGEWQQADVKRAIDAAEEAGLSSYRIEIAPDGSISVIVGDPGDTAPPDPYRDLFRQP